MKVTIYRRTLWDRDGEEVQEHTYGLKRGVNGGEPCVELSEAQWESYRDLVEHWTAFQDALEEMYRTAGKPSRVDLLLDVMPGADPALIKKMAEEQARKEHERAMERWLREKPPEPKGIP